MGHMRKRMSGDSFGHFVAWDLRHVTILFMDDEAGVRHVGARLLRKRGHRVMEAADQREAEVAARNGDIDGVRTARALNRINPLIRILLVSGGPRPSDQFHFLSKPYEIDDVLRLLSAIDGNDQRP
jgi:CheY-like chemotaxis protein